MIIILYRVRYSQTWKPWDELKYHSFRAAMSVWSDLSRTYPEYEFEMSSPV